MIRTPAHRDECRCSQCDLLRAAEGLAELRCDGGVDNAASNLSAVPSPLCHCDPCDRRGRAVLDDAEDLGGCLNRRVHCLTCGTTGELSERKE
jgi:hypothetical protein